MSVRPKETFAAAEHQRIREKPKLVDEIVREEECTSSLDPCVKGGSVLLLELPQRTDDVAAEPAAVLPRERLI